MKSLRRGVSQPVPSALVVVTFSSPFGFPRESASRICVGRQFAEDFLRRAVKEFALLRQDEPARMAMKKRNIQIAFKRADVTADRRLADAQRLAGMRETSRFRCSVENPKFVPIHRQTAAPSALFRCLRHRFQTCQIALGIERRHASHACGCDSLTVCVIGYVARGEDPGDIGCTPTLLP